jgi:hypothetical protein
VVCSLTPNKVFFYKIFVPIPWNKSCWGS